MLSSDKYKTVSDVVSALKVSLESGFRNLQVLGEVTNLTRSASGHYYFSLTDAGASLQCSFFKGDALRCPAIKKIKNGDKVLCFGSMGVYAQRGTMQLVAKRISTVGEGDLWAQLEALRERLSKEGLFDSTQKMKIPSYPKKIGLITSLKGAAIQDFIKIYERRSLWSDILVTPSLMQGSSASKSVVSSLRRLIRYHLEKEGQLDVIVITRGGGSLEDLWCFNDEALAWEIHNCPIPVISAIGHEIDYTICDLVADWRCETPSAAAELLSEKQVGLRERFETSFENLSQKSFLIQERLRQTKQRIDPRYWMSLIEHLLSKSQLKLHKLNLSHRAYELVDYYGQSMRLEESYKALETYTSSIKDSVKKVDEIFKILNALNPDNVLKRGYSYIKSQDGVITSASQLDKLERDENLEVNFYDGVSKVKKS